MPFVLIGRDRSDGVVRLVTETSYDTRESALDDLPLMLPADGSMDVHDIFVVDLDTVSPVVFVRPSKADADVPTIDEPIGTTWVAEDSEGSDEMTDEMAAAALADAPDDIPEGLLEPDDEATVDESSAGGLAAALRRAATQLEDEGITAPPQVEELAAMAAEGPEAGEDGDAAEGVSPEPEAEEPEDVPEEPMSTREDEEESKSWPWEDASLPEDAGAGYDDIQMIATPVDGAEARPVIMGDYGADATVESGQDASNEEPADEEPAVADVLPEEPPVVEPASGEPPPEETAAEEAPVEEPAAEEPPPEETALGDPDIQDPVDDTAADDLAGIEAPATDEGAYTCDDCVYVGTCPKAHKETPTTCGSFQWKS